MDKNSPTYKVAVSIIKQSQEKCDHDYFWFISTIMHFLSLDENMSLLDFIRVLKEEVPDTENMINILNQRCFRCEV